MNRREALKRMAVLAGGTLSATTITAVMNGCRAGEADRALRTLSAHQNKLIIVLTELIMPETDTPGAKTANVNQFVDKMLTDWNYEEEREQFLSELNAIDPLSRKKFGSLFLDLDRGQQKEILQQKEKEARQSKDKGAYKPFFDMLKEYTVVGYFTSEVGAGEVMGWTAVPGKYEGNLDQPPGKR